MQGSGATFDTCEIVDRQDFKEAIIWPKDWPDLSHPKAVRSKDKNLLFIEKSQYKKLTDLLSKRKEGQGANISGKDWAVASRFPFPLRVPWVTHL
jgi:hypothetical protein